MPKITIRPGVRRFGPIVAPGGGATIGAGLQDIGQALGSIADLKTNKELFSIQEQEQIDRLEQAQFEKVERSEAIVQFTAKQISRNETAAQILNEAKKIRNYADVQKGMDDWEKGFNEELFNGRSQEFRDIFESMDRSARVGQINKLGNAIQAGNLGIIKDNYQLSADNFVDSVDALSDPAEIVDFFDTLKATGVNMGMRVDAIEAVVGNGVRESMEKHVRSLPLVDGLAALSDENVAKALGEDGREALRRELNTKANTLQRAQQITSDAHEGVVGINIANALHRGLSATALITQIRDDDALSPVRKRDMVDLIRAVSIAREKGPQPVDSEIIAANEELSELLMGRRVKEIEAIRKNEDPKRSRDERKEATRKVIDDAILTYREAVLKEAKGGFGKAELVRLKSKLDEIIEPVLVIEEIAKSGLLENLQLATDFLLSPVSAFKTMRERMSGIFSPELDLRVPNAEVSREIRMMFLGDGKYGNLSSEDKASMEAFLIDAAIRIENAGKPLPEEEFKAITQNIFASAQKRFLEEEKRVNPEVIEEVEGLFFNTGVPITKPRQRVNISELADMVRIGLNQGMTEKTLRKLAQEDAGFSDEAFDRALATVLGVR